MPLTERGEAGTSVGECRQCRTFCDRLIDRAPLTIFGDGQQTRDYVYAGDVARAHVLAARAELPPPGELDSRAFNIGTSIETSVLELARILRETSDSPSEVKHAPPRAGEQRRSAVRIDKAAQVLGWRPEMPLERGLRKTFEWFAARRAEANR